MGEMVASKRGGESWSKLNFGEKNRILLFHNGCGFKGRQIFALIASPPQKLQGLCYTHKGRLGYLFTIKVEANLLILHLQNNISTIYKSISFNSVLFRRRLSKG